MKRNAKPIRAFKRVTPEQEQAAADIMVPVLCLAKLQHLTLNSQWGVLDNALAESDLKDSLRRIMAQSNNLCKIFEERINDELMEGLLDDSGRIYDKYVVPMTEDSKAARERHKAQKGAKNGN